MASGTVDRSALVAAFHSILSADAVLYDPEQLKPYECDGLTAYRQTPLVVVLPETIEQVQNILSLCHRKQGTSGGQGCRHRTFRWCPAP